MADGESVVSVGRRARWWRSRPVVGFVSLVAAAGVGLGIWSATREDAASGWHSVALPQAVGARDSSLNAVTVLPDGTAWAVGYVDVGSGHTAVQRWDGHQWAAVPTPGLGGESSEFNGVSASSAEDAWAVGLTSTVPDPNGAPASGYTDSSLIEHWDGARWSALEAAARPRLSSASADLQGVAAISATSAWAVGRDGGTALIEHWDGARWSVSPNPDLNSDKSGGALFGVVAVSPADVWAVGENSVAAKDSCLIEHWDGASWRTVACPVPADEHKARLLAVTEVSPRDLWAVGYYTTGDDPLAQTAHSLVEHFDGVGWSRIPSPRVAVGSGPAGEAADELIAVAGRSADDVYAASPNGEVVHWDGKHWTLSSFRLAGMYVWGMAARAGGSVWVVGSQSGEHPAWLVNVENP
jgi:hypothetical protein